MASCLRTNEKLTNHSMSLVSHQNTANVASIQEIAVRHKRTPLVPMYHVQQQDQMHQAMGSNPGFQPAFQAAPLISSP